MLLISTVMLVVRMHATDAFGHCTDKKRGLIMDSCQDLLTWHRQHKAPFSSQERAIVKRENEDETMFSVESLPKNGESVIRFRNVTN